LETEHLLLGLIKLGSDTGADVLIEMDIDLGKLRNKIETSVGSGPDQRLTDIRYTPRSRIVLNLASKEARTLKQTCIGTEHILLGLLAEDDNVAARILKIEGVNLAAARNTLKKLYARLPSD
jgi:ATP-dependent Clp protease ATP-binding subunit ClpC